MDAFAAKVTELLVHPLKSARAIHLPSVAVERWGFRDDRRWAVIDADGEKLRAKHHPIISAVDATSLPGGELRLSAAGMPAIFVPQPTSDRVVATSISNLPFAYLADSVASKWLTELIGQRVRLIWLKNPRVRPVLATRGGEKGDVLNLSDAGPVLVTSTESLRLLDEWTAETAASLGEPPPTPLDMRRFRPNVVVHGGEPFAEDYWKRLSIGGVPFRVSELCSRCAVTMIDPLTLASGPEPMRTLVLRRRYDGKVWFGVRLVPETAGEIEVGDGIVLNGDAGRGRQ